MTRSAGPADAIHIDNDDGDDDAAPEQAAVNLVHGQGATRPWMRCLSARAVVATLVLGCSGALGAAVAHRFTSTVDLVLLGG